MENRRKFFLFFFSLPWSNLECNWHPVTLMLEVWRMRLFSLSSRQFDSRCLLTKIDTFHQVGAMYQPSWSCKPCKRRQGPVRRWQIVRVGRWRRRVREREKTTAGKGWVQGEKSQMKRVRETEEGGLDRGQTDERTHLNKGSVILLSERKIEMVDLRIRTKQTTIRSIFFYRILSVGKVNWTMCHIRRQMFIQYLLQCYF